MTSQKAALGIGLEEGVAEDFGNAAAWLAVHDIYSVPVLHKALVSVQSKCVTYGQWAQMNGIVTWGSDDDSKQLSAALIGGAAADLYGLVSPREDACIRLRELDIPVLQLAFFANASRPVCTEVSWMDNSAEVKVILARTGQWTNVDRHALAAEGLYDFNVVRVKEPEINELDSKYSPVAASHDIYLNGYEVNGDHWSALKALAELMLVEPSERSRLSGAGAGLTDND